MNPNGKGHFTTVRRDFGADFGGHFVGSVVGFARPFYMIR